VRGRDFHQTASRGATAGRHPSLITHPPTTPIHDCHSAPVTFLVVVMYSAFVASLAGFLIMHLQLVAANCTTIEMWEKVSQLHNVRNVQMVCGMENLYVA
jgi:hypothetical protein